MPSFIKPPSSRACRVRQFNLDPSPPPIVSSMIFMRCPPLKNHSFIHLHHFMHLVALGSTTLGLGSTTLRSTTLGLRSTTLGLLAAAKLIGHDLNIHAVSGVAGSDFGRAQATAKCTAAFFMVGRRGRLLVGILGLLQKFHETQTGILFANVTHVRHPCIEFFCHVVCVCVFYVMTKQEKIYFKLI
jgi:hypothetical protein